MSHRDLVISDDVFNHHWLADSMLGFPLLNYGTGAQYGVSIALLVCSGGSDISIGAPVRRNHNRCFYSFSLMYGAYNVSSTSNPTSGGSMALGRSPCCQLTWTVVSSLKHAAGANGNLEHTGRCDSARAGWIYYSREWYSHDFVQKQDGSMNPWVHDHRKCTDRFQETDFCVIAGLSVYYQIVLYSFQSSLSADNRCLLRDVYALACNLEARRRASENLSPSTFWRSAKKNHESGTQGSQSNNGGSYDYHYGSGYSIFTTQLK